MADLPRLDALAQAQLVQEGHVSALELTEAAISRAEAVNLTLNLLTERLYESARAAAAKLDRELRADRALGPLAGAPMLVKDHLATIAGVRHTEGSAFLRNHVAAADSELVRRYRAAGLVFIATVSTPEFALQSTTEPALYGRTRNPWDTARSPGGSSGASSSAAAAGVVPVAHGNDSGGSLRIPASCCGVYGFKPTRARNSLAPYGDLAGIWCEHVITRSVRDSAAVLDASAGPAPGDPYAPPGGPAMAFLDAAEATPPKLRIGFSAGPLAGGEQLHPDCARAVADAAALCEQLGHSVSEVTPPADWPGAEAAFLTVFASACAAWVDGWAARLGREPGTDELEPFTRALAERGRAISAAELLDAIETLQQLGRAIAAFHDCHDVWLTPTLATPPPPLGYFDPPLPPGDPLEVLERDSRFTPFTWVANATGAPAASLPLHWSAEGLPVGVMIAARPGAEATLFSLSAQLEAARPWADRLAPVSATQVSP